MGLTHVSHSEIVRFAKDYVNLSEKKANEHRAQAKRLTDRLRSHLEEHPDFSLKRLVPSGSLAKGTALKSLNDIDVGCYITGFDTNTDISELITFLVEKLRIAFSNMDPEQITPQTHSVSVAFRGSGLDVDIVPVLYDNDPDWYGYLWNQKNGKFLKTNIPLQVEFIRKRKSKNKRHFSQLARLVKYWIKEKKKENEGFKFKSFMAELILAKLADDDMDYSNYVEGLQYFFTYILKTDIGDLIAFDDYYKISTIPTHNDLVKIIDPVNADNNAAKYYTQENVDKIVELAEEASDAIDAAIFATTKEKTVYYWQKVFGNSFNP